MKLLQFHHNLKITMKRTNPKASYKQRIIEWCGLWNRNAAGIVAVILYLALFCYGLIYILVIHKAHNNGGGHNKILKTQSDIVLEKALRISEKCSEGDKCMITCNDLNQEEMQNITDLISSATISDCETLGIRLFLQNAEFPNRKIQNGWLENCSYDINTLTINSPNLRDMEPRAFAGKPFINKPITLELVDTHIAYFQKEWFLESHIETFAVRFDTNIQPVTVEKGVLEGMSNSLVSLQFANCIDDIQTVQNLTGPTAPKLTHLKILDLQSNHIVKITNQSFIAAPGLTSLYLNDISLEELEVGAFYGIQNGVQLLQFKQNQLELLPEGLFRGFINGIDRTINIEKNPFKCNCSMEWFRQFYEEYQSDYFKNVTFLCFTDEGLYVNYTEAAFCSEVTTIPPKSSSEASIPPTSEENTSNLPTIITEMATTIPPETSSKATTFSTITEIIPTPSHDTKTIECTGNSVLVGFLQQDLRPFATASVRNGTITYQFVQYVGTKHINLYVLGGGDVSNDLLIWTSNPKSDNPKQGCISDLGAIISLLDLDYGKAYTLCLLPIGNDTVAPDDCTTLPVPQHWDQQSWISNDDKLGVVVTMCCVTVLVCIASGVGAFYFIRQNPQLIKGNKRVVVVGNKHETCREYTKSSRFSLAGSDGYLKPKNYETVCTLSRSCESLYSEAPPLPPNHPRKHNDDNRMECC